MDRAAFRLVATRHWPGAEDVLPRLSRSANHGRLWFAVAAGIAASGSPRARRCAARGIASLAVASATVNTLGKRSVRRARPLLEGVPLVRQLRRQPITTSFPSGHSASAAAFATGVALESRRWGAVVAPVAASVAFSRVYTGVHYPSDVLAGAALGVGAAFAVRGVAPTHSQLPPTARPVAEAPALREGKGLVVVTNASSGPSGRTATAPEADDADDAPQQDAGGDARVPVAESAEDTSAAEVRSVLPRAEVVAYGPRDGALRDVLEEAAQRALALGGALGVHGGDGSVNAAATVAARHGLPLAVLPGGTRNHFAYDLGIESADHTARAVTAGEAVAVDLGRFAPVGPDGGPGEGPSGYFVNTFSLGSYPELVRLRERWAPLMGSRAAGVLAAWHVLRTSRPVEAGVAGRQRPLWLMFVGNCTYRGVGLAPVRRHDLADGLLDVRTVRGGRFARTRLLSAAVAGALGRRSRRSSAKLRSLLVTGLPEGSHLAYDGEVAEAPGQLLLDKEREALVVYRPMPD
ncbi:phosphatase PAP2 family protein [Streptomyces sp. NPDC054796]